MGDDVLTPADLFDLHYVAQGQTVTTEAGRVLGGKVNVTWTVSKEKWRSD